jgi:Tfp pilus assembly protein PilF
MLQDGSQLMRSMLELQGPNTATLKACVNWINATYDAAYELHLIVTDHTQLEIQWPRLNLIEMNPHGKESKVLALKKQQDKTQEKEEVTEETDVHPRRYGKAGLYALEGGVSNEPLPDDDIENEDELDIIPHFHLSLEVVQRAYEHGPSQVDHLEWQREKKYDDALSEGHQAILKKEHSAALDSFSKARNYRETAEILTLMGWTHSLMAEMEKAKSYCLKAIKQDADYGPAYNDLGSYLLSEGQVEEALKWFDLAKKAPNYQNREYPYINAGRAYMTKRKLGRALDEFSKALTLAPYHDELHSTVEKLKKSLKPVEDESSTHPKEDGPNT